MQVGVFGANGFLGCHVTRALIARQMTTICFGRRFSRDFDEEFKDAVETRLIDLSDTLQTHAKLADVTHVVQLINSSNATIGNKRTVFDIEANLIPQVSFIDSCIMSGVKSFTFISSGGTVYGRAKTIPITEDHPTQPLNSYGLVKLSTEHYLQMLCRDSSMGYTILRVANPYGPGQLGAGGQGLIGTILHRHRQGLPVTIFGDGLSERDYLYIDDTAGAIVRAVGQPPLNDVVNVGSGTGRSILDVLAAVETALGSSIPREHLENRATDAPSNILSTDKAARLLGWRATTPFELGIAKTVEWYMRDNPRGDAPAHPPRTPRYHGDS